MASPTHLTGRIDVHHHIFPPSIGKAGLSAKVGWRTPPQNLPWTPELSLRAMDQLGVQIAVLSIPAGLPPGPAGEENRAAARQFNDYAAQICADHPGRFGFFACLPDMSDTQGALAEIRHGLDELGAWGIAMSSSYGDAADAKYIGDDAFDPVWEELDRRSAVVFLHGAQVASSTPYPHPFLGIPVTEVPNETFKAAAHLVVTGKKRRWPRARIVLAHLGGSTPFLAPRVAGLAPHMGCALAPDEILADFRTFYFDTALGAHATTLAAMRAFADDGRVLFGTDFPGESVARIVLSTVCPARRRLLTSARRGAVSTGMAEWYTKNADAFYAGDGDRVALEQVMYKNAQALLGIKF